MNAIQSLKEKLTSKEAGVAGLDAVAIGIVIFVVTSVAGIVALVTLNDTDVVAASPDAQDAVNKGVSGIKTLLIFLSVISTVIALTVLIAYLRRSNQS